MKYIRTKDGRLYEVTATPRTNPLIYGGTQFIQVYDEQECVRRDIYMSDVIKQANTIEELCDDYVVISEGKHIVVHYIEDTYEETLELDYSVFGDHEIYGSIWIGPNLHSVAKMNEKGEWELL